MTKGQISHLRLAAQHIGSAPFKTAKEVVSWMGAVQAQDKYMSKWAVGIRMAHATEKIIDAAISNGDILRTHVLRPTWHYVSPEDIWWMLQLTAPRIKSLLKGRHKELELTPAVLKKTISLIEKTLAKSNHSTREELIEVFKKAKIAVNESRASHLFLWAELEGLICSGPLKNKASTFALLSERTSVKQKFTKEEALAKLALKYFQSHGPASIQDFTWWSGLSLTEAKHGLEMNNKVLLSEKVKEQTYWFHEPSGRTIAKKDAAYLLPAFDEFIIAYKDRSAIIPDDVHKKTISENGIFRPTILINGKLTGLWNRTIKKDEIVITPDYFKKISTSTLRMYNKAAKQYERFVSG